MSVQGHTELDSLRGHVRRLEASNQELGERLHRVEIALHAGLKAKSHESDSIHRLADSLVTCTGHNADLIRADAHGSGPPSVAQPIRSKRHEPFSR